MSIIYANLCRIFNIVQSFRYFIGKILDSCSVQPVNIFKIKHKLCILEQNLEFKILLTKHCSALLYVQQGGIIILVTAVMEMLQGFKSQAFHSLFILFSNINALTVK